MSMLCILTEHIGVTDACENDGEVGGAEAQAFIPEVSTINSITNTKN